MNSSSIGLPSRSEGSSLASMDFSVMCGHLCCEKTVTAILTAFAQQHNQQQAEISQLRTDYEGMKSYVENEFRKLVSAPIDPATKTKKAFKAGKWNVTSAALREFALQNNFIKLIGHVFSDADKELFRQHPTRETLPEDTQAALKELICKYIIKK